MNKVMLRGSLRRWVRLSAAIVCLSYLGVAAATRANAEERSFSPRSEEWWFGSWQVQSKVWPQAQGQGSVVAVLDTGVQADIPDLSGVVLPGTDATGDGGDGRTDKDPDPVAPGHGTAMSTLIAGQGGPNHFVGLAPRAKILPVTVHSSSAANVPAIHYAVDHGANVISISQGVAGPCQDDLQQAVAYALKHNVVVVAGAGNLGRDDNPRMMPADCAGVLAVGAVGVSGQSFVTWPGTERQPYVTVGAPGMDVGGILLDGRYHSSPGGTSGATALTSATVALIRSKYPHMSAREVVHRVIGSCLDITPAGKDDRSGYGLIRPNRALSGQGLSNAPNTVFAAYDKWKAEQAEERRSATPQASADSSSSSFPVLPVAAVVVFFSLVIATAIFARAARKSRT